jgi:hypothetical protein
MKRTCNSWSISLRCLATLLALVMVFGTCSRSMAQTPSLDVYYDKLDPKTSFKYKWKGEEKACNVGAFHWEVPKSEFGTGGLDRNFTGYCAEIDVPILENKLYRFRQLSLLEPRSYGLEATPEGIRAAEHRATLIRELFGRYYFENKLAHPTETFAFQVALWELTHETEPIDRAVSFDLFSGDFQANYPKDQAPDFVLLAQAYLDSLTGNDAIYYQNQDINGRELIRLQGIPNAEGVVAQSQYALRYINGGASGVGPFAGLLGNSGLGGGIGGIGGGLGGGGLGAGDTSGGGAPLLSTGGFPSTTGGPPSSSPPPGTGTRVPAGGPQGTPVPAPAGLLLGLIAIGALASRRIYTRLLQN